MIFIFPSIGFLKGVASRSNLEARKISFLVWLDCSMLDLPFCTSRSGGEAS
jgi:hypothetical protein